MATSYPAGLDAFSTSHADNVGEVIHSSTINDLADAVNKIEGELGTLPKGTYATAVARLDALEKPATNVQAGTTYTLVLSDASKVVEMNNAGAIVLTVPPNSSVAFPTGTIIELFQYGAGQVTVTPGAAVTIRAAGAKSKLAFQYSSATIRKRATDEWVLAGDIV